MGRKLFSRMPTCNVRPKPLLSGPISTRAKFVVPQSVVLVDRRVHRDFLDLLVQEAKNLLVGDPFDSCSQNGPDEQRFGAGKNRESPRRCFKERSSGRVWWSKDLLGHPTNMFFEPTVIDNVTADTLLNTEETFGPVVPADYG